MHESYLPPKIYIINHISGNCRSASDKLMPDAKKNNNENLKSLAAIIKQKVVINFQCFR